MIGANATLKSVDLQWIELIDCLYGTGNLYGLNKGQIRPLSDIWESYFFTSMELLIAAMVKRSVNFFIFTLCRNTNSSPIRRDICKKFNCFCATILTLIVIIRITLRLWTDVHLYFQLDGTGIYGMVPFFIQYGDIVSMQLLMVNSCLSIITIIGLAPLWAPQMIVSAVCDLLSCPFLWCCSTSMRTAVCSCHLGCSTCCSKLWVVLCFHSCLHTFWLVIVGFAGVITPIIISIPFLPIIFAYWLLKGIICGILHLFIMIFRETFCGVENPLGEHITLLRYWRKDYQKKDYPHNIESFVSTPTKFAFRIHYLIFVVLFGMISLSEAATLMTTSLYPNAQYCFFDWGTEFENAFHPVSALWVGAWEALKTLYLRFFDFSSLNFVWYAPNPKDFFIIYPDFKIFRASIIFTDIIISIFLGQTDFKHNMIPEHKVTANEPKTHPVEF